VFTLILREAVPPTRLTPLLSRRNVALNIVLGISILIFGHWLETAPFPANYQVMFGVGFVFTLLSLWHVMRVRVTEERSLLHPPPSASAPARAWRSPSFQMVAFVAAFMHVAFFSIVSVTPLRLVNELGAAEQFMALFGMVELSAAIAVSLVTSRFVARWGNRALIAASMIATGLAALVLAFSGTLSLTLLAAVLSGAGWTAATIGLFGYFTENTAPQDMPRFTAAYTQVVYLAVFIGPLLGSSLANSGANLTAVLLLGAVLRLLAGALTSATGALTVRRLALILHIH
jgi:predicted MFS family arabinose efflux permease